MKPLIVANWKMNPESLVEAKRNFEIIKKGVRNIKKVEPVICAPFIFLPLLKATNHLKLGAQDCFWEDKGPFTGEISPTQLKNLGVDYVILGHSERRKYLGESTELVNRKIIAALETGLKVIFCIGSETKKPDKEMKYQLKIGLRGVRKQDVAKLVFVYEPVWAISTSKNKVIATPHEALKGGLYIRNVLGEIFDKETAKKAKIIYGGSVDSRNIRGFIKDGKMAGGLPGAASLDPHEFVRIVKKVDESLGH
ncbi:MAG: triose-phosphate isomerase [Candidatus Pacebacteria bacterium]|nr:triose-phosphate isomerase [Candidatus Paceibacterota bacterium]